MWPIVADFMAAVAYVPAPSLPAGLARVLVSVPDWLAGAADLAGDAASLQHALIDTELAHARFAGAHATLCFDTAPWMPLHAPLDRGALALEAAACGAPDAFGAWPARAWHHSVLYQWQWLAHLRHALVCRPPLASLVLDAVPDLPPTFSLNRETMRDAACDALGARALATIGRLAGDTLVQTLVARCVAESVGRYAQVAVGGGTASPTLVLPATPFFAAALAKVCALAVAHAHAHADAPPTITLVVAPTADALVALLAWAELPVAERAARALWLEVPAGHARRAYVCVGELATRLAAYGRAKVPADSARPVALMALVAALARGDELFGRALYERLHAPADALGDPDAQPLPPLLALPPGCCDREAAAQWYLDAWRRRVPSARADGRWTAEVPRVDWYFALRAHDLVPSASSVQAARMTEQAPAAARIARAVFALLTAGAEVQARPARFFAGGEAHEERDQRPSATGWRLVQTTDPARIAAALAAGRITLVAAAAADDDLPAGRIGGRFVLKLLTEREAAAAALPTRLTLLSLVPLL